MVWRTLKTWVLALLLFGAVALAQPARATGCNFATAQGTTGPSTWQTYCWLDFTAYNDTTARSVSGQNFSVSLSDGTTLTFNLKVSGAIMAGAASPAWYGAAVGNTAFLGIGGKPILYQGASGTSTATISAITLTPPPGGSSISNYMFVAADAESTNGGESLSFTTNGGNWAVLDRAGPISGSTYPTASGENTATFSLSGIDGYVGGYIAGSTAPTTVSTTLVGSGLQGVMFAIRFASIRLYQQIGSTRIHAADQFSFSVASSSGGTVLASGSSSGTGLGPFAAAALSASSNLALTLAMNMAPGSISALSQYKSMLSCTNSSAGSGTAMPNGAVTTSYSFGALQYGDTVQCTFTATPWPHIALQKALGSGGRQFDADQFTVKIMQGGSTIASATTSGTGATLGGGSIALTQVLPGSSYALQEVGEGWTSLGQYTSALACINAASGSSTVLPTAAGASISPQMGDVVACTLTNTKRGSNAALSVQKTSSLLSDPANGAVQPKAIPGAVVRYAVSVRNYGPTATDSGSVLVVDMLPGSLAVGTAASPSFSDGSPSSGLAFNPASDIGFSTSATLPASFAQCTYTPTAAYDPAVRYLCVNPKGALAGSTGIPPGFTVSFQAQVR